MLRSYLTLAVRNLRKHPAYSLINVAGLAIGLACFILILLFVRDELSYDRHHEHADDIYRLVVNIQTENDYTENAHSAGPWGPTMQRDYPEVESMVRMKPPNQKWMVGREDRSFYEKGVAFVDSTIFDVFSIPLVRGNPKTVLEAPHKAVLSEEMVAKYFPHGDDPIGKTISLDNQYDFEVTGIMEDMPSTSHFRFGFLLSASTLNVVPIYGSTDFLDDPFPQIYTYVRLAPGTSPEVLEAKFPDFVESAIAAQFPIEDMGMNVELHLQPLTDIHLRSQRSFEIGTNGDINTVYIFLAVALFILVIASINFMNLATARSASRALEVGLRKSVGAPRSSLIGQFIGESVLLGFVALIVAIPPVWIGLSQFNAVTGKSISMASLADPTVVALLVGVALVVGLFAGSYPAFFLSAFEPATVLKGEIRSGSGKGRLLRKGLIVFQFCISIALIVGTGIVYQQMSFLSNQSLGFDKEHVVIVELTDPNPRTLYRTYRQALERSPDIVAVSASSSSPGGNVFEFQMQPLAAAPDENFTLRAYMTDYEFIETMGIDVLAGRTQSPDFPVDSVGSANGAQEGEVVRSTVVLNEAAAKDFGWPTPEQALDEEITFAGGGNLVYRVIGVVDDFHSRSAHETIDPAMLIFGNEQFYFYTLVRIAGRSVPQTIDFIERTWNEIMPGYAFEYTFLDQQFAGQYRMDRLVGTVLGFFALLTVLIACLGLFGLASFTAEQRTKEIGVRKTLGASVSSIQMLLSREFAILVAIAFVIAAPASLWLMSRWLDGFAYRISIADAWPLVLASGVGALVIALLTVSFQSFRAASVNPVESLRYE